MQRGIWLDPWKIRSREIQHGMEIIEVLLIISTKVGRVSLPSNTGKEQELSGGNKSRMKLQLVHMLIRLINVEGKVFYCFCVKG